MKKYFLLAFAMVATLATAQTETYKEGNLTVAYPSSFKAKKTANSAATFSAPDESIIFYAYKPKKAALPTDIDLKRDS